MLTPLFESCTRVAPVQVVADFTTSHGEGGRLRLVHREVRIRSRVLIVAVGCVVVEVEHLASDARRARVRYALPMMQGALVLPLVRVGMRNGSSPRSDRTRRSRPPVCVPCPVSTRVTRQSSRGVSSTSTDLVAKSIVTSAPRANESAKYRLMYSPLYPRHTMNSRYPYRE